MDQTSHRNHKITQTSMRFSTTLLTTFLALHIAQSQLTEADIEVPNDSIDKECHGHMYFNGDRYLCCPAMAHCLIP